MDSYSKHSDDVLGDASAGDNTGIDSGKLVRTYEFKDFLRKCNVDSDNLLKNIEDACGVLHEHLNISERSAGADDKFAGSLEEAGDALANIYVTASRFFEAEYGWHDKNEYIDETDDDIIEGRRKCKEDFNERVRNEDYTNELIKHLAPLAPLTEKIIDALSDSKTQAEFATPEDIVSHNGRLEIVELIFNADWRLKSIDSAKDVIYYTELAANLIPNSNRQIKSITKKSLPILLGDDSAAAIKCLRDIADEIEAIGQERAPAPAKKRGNRKNKSTTRKDPWGLPIANLLRREVEVMQRHVDAITTIEEFRIVDSPTTEIIMPELETAPPQVESSITSASPDLSAEQTESDTFTATPSPVADSFSSETQTSKKSRRESKNGNNGSSSQSIIETANQKKEREAAARQAWDEFGAARKSFNDNYSMLPKKIYELGLESFIRYLSTEDKNGQHPLTRDKAKEIAATVHRLLYLDDAELRTEIETYEALLETRKQLRKLEYNGHKRSDYVFDLYGNISLMRFGYEPESDERRPDDPYRMWWHIISSMGYFYPATDAEKAHKRYRPDFPGLAAVARLLKLFGVERDDDAFPTNEQLIKGWGWQPPQPEPEPEPEPEPVDENLKPEEETPPETQYDQAKRFFDGQDGLEVFATKSESHNNGSHFGLQINKGRISSKLNDERIGMMDYLADSDLFTKTTVYEEKRGDKRNMFLLVEHEDGIGYMVVENRNDDNMLYIFRTDICQYDYEKILGIMKNTPKLEVREIEGVGYVQHNKGFTAESLGAAVYFKIGDLSKLTPELRIIRN